ncbi:glutamate-gated chloride channel-like [Panulirus ornatus]|uniref:glutamate-gated chloride channel-like n=1 Tax=Panulirus ornatus TaxID=150431 RepID=UPI003A89CC24
MFYYPFDTQRCLLEMREAASTNSFVVFDNVRIAYLGEENVGSYSVSSIRAHIEDELSSDANYSAIKVEFLLARQPTTTVMSVFIPTMMLVAIGYSTLHLDLGLTQVRMVVSLTTLLVLYTLFSQTNSSLPKTAYIKMVDVWFFLCICKLFTIIIFHVYVEKLSDTVRGNVVRVGPVAKVASAQQRALQVMRSRIVPLALLLCLVVFWGVMVAGIASQ